MGSISFCLAPWRWPLPHPPGGSTFLREQNYGINLFFTMPKVAHILVKHSPAARSANPLIP